MQLSHPTTSWPVSVAGELDFLRERTGKDESALLAEAVRVGLETLYRRTIEEMFIDDEIPRPQAVAVLAEERVASLEYAKKALTDDVEQAFLE